MEVWDMVILGLQLILSVIFLYFGFLKMFMPIDKIAKKVSWARDYSINKLKFFGFLEVIGGLGVILPYQLDVLPILTPMAATGLAMVMAGAAMVHLRRDEINMIFLNILMIFMLAGVGFNSLLDIFNVEVTMN